MAHKEQLTVKGRGRGEANRGGGRRRWLRCLRGGARAGYARGERRAQLQLFACRAEQTRGARALRDNLRRGRGQRGAQISCLNPTVGPATRQWPALRPFAPGFGSRPSAFRHSSGPPRFHRSSSRVYSSADCAFRFFYSMGRCVGTVAISRARCATLACGSECGVLLRWNLRR